MLTADRRVVMISGANRGIGLAIARRLSADGYRISLGARDTATLSAQHFAGESMLHHWDANDTVSSQQWVRGTVEQFGQIDAVVMNAGVIISAGINSPEADFDTMWDVNFKGPLRLIKAALPELKQGTQGRVINIVSLSGKRLMGAGNLGYSASKFASMALTHAIRQDGWNDGVRATAICPGLVDTDMVASVQTPEGEFKITPEAIAGTCAYALSLPNDASVAEILVNSRLEPSF